MTQDEVIKLVQGNQLPQYDIRDAEAGVDRLGMAFDQAQERRTNLLVQGIVRRRRADAHAVNE